MQLIRKKAFARAGLMGNPSDGYHGKTLSLVIRDFAAEVTLYEWDRIEVVFSQHDQTRFDSIDELVRDVRLHGYYGGIRLVKATIKKFVEYCRRQGHLLHGRNFSVRYQSDIPRQVGMAGSSAIIVATLRCLMEFYDVDIPLQVQPSLVLSVETEELGIAAGLQDRVVQVYEGPVYMNFAREVMQDRGGLQCGVYEPIDPTLLPPLYVAYSTDVSEPTEIIHNRQGNPGIAKRFPWLVAFIFGLLHGFGFAGALAEIGLPQQSIPLALLFFNVGVELGQLLFVATVVSMGWVLKRMFTEKLLQGSEVAASYLIGSLSAYWVIERTYSFLA